MKDKKYVVFPTHSDKKFVHVAQIEDVFEDTYGDECLQLCACDIEGYLFKKYIYQHDKDKIITDYETAKKIYENCQSKLKATKGIIKNATENYNTFVADYFESLKE